MCIFYFLFAYIICLMLSLFVAQLFLQLIRSEGVMVFKAIFNDISVILWRLVVMAEETGVPGENHRDLLQVTD